MKKKLFTALLTSALVLSFGMTVSANSTTTYMNYDGYKVDCKLVVDWNTFDKDEGYAKTYADYPFTYEVGAFCNAYQNGKMIGGVSNRDTRSVNSGTCYAHADEFRSVHSIYNRGRVVKSTKLTLEYW